MVKEILVLVYCVVTTVAFIVMIARSKFCRGNQMIWFPTLSSAYILIMFVPSLINSGWDIHTPYSGIMLLFCMPVLKLIDYEKVEIFLLGSSPSDWSDQLLLLLTMLFWSLVAFPLGVLIEFLRRRYNVKN